MSIQNGIVDGEFVVVDPPVNRMQEIILREMYSDNLKMSETLLQVRSFALAKSELRSAIEKIEQIEALFPRTDTNSTNDH